MQAFKYEQDMNVNIMRMKPQANQQVRTCTGRKQTGPLHGRGSGDKRLPDKLSFQEDCATLSFSRTDMNQTPESSRLPKVTWDNGIRKYFGMTTSFGNK